MIPFPTISSYYFIGFAISFNTGPYAALNTSNVDIINHPYCALHLDIEETKHPIR